MENKNPTYPLFFPEDIIYLILLFLPVKSLLRFWLVCKSWLSLIFASDFIKNHLLVSYYDPYLTHHRLILAKQPLGSQLCPQILKLSTCSLYSLLTENLTKYMRYKPLIDTTEGEINRIVSYCNGLVCLINVEKCHVVFWNPSTRKSRRLPKLDMIRKGDCTYYGFCFDEFTDDFKVFAIFGCSKYEVSVYSSKSDSWTLIGDFPFKGVWYDGKFADGAIYWFVEEPIFKKVIMSFDIKTESYREIMLPKQIYEEESQPFWILDTFGSSPCILHEFGTHVDFWVLEERGPEESWTKWFTIPYSRPAGKNIKLINFFENGDILLNIYETVVMYNSRDNIFQTLLDFYIEGLEVHCYVESLVSP